MRLLDVMAQLTPRQRGVLAAMGFANLVAFTALVAMLIRSPSTASSTVSPSPLEPQLLAQCRVALSQALLDAGQSALVHVRQDGTAMIYLERPYVLGAMRLSADSATWTAFEAVASRRACLDLRTIQVNVVLNRSSENSLYGSGPDSAEERQPNGIVASTAEGAGRASERALQAMAHVSVADLVLWSLGEIDDGELARRIEYQPPTLLSPVSSPATAIP